MRNARRPISQVMPSTPCLRCGPIPHEDLTCNGVGHSFRARHEGRGPPWASAMISGREPQRREWLIERDSRPDLINSFDGHPRPTKNVPSPYDLPQADRNRNHLLDWEHDESEGEGRCEGGGDGEQTRTRLGRTGRPARREGGPPNQLPPPQESHQRTLTVYRRFVSHSVEHGSELARIPFQPPPPTAS